MHQVNIMFFLVKLGALRVLVVRTFSLTNYQAY